MARTVVIQRQALESLRRVSNFISEHISPSSGFRWLAVAKINIQELATDADQWPEADEAQILKVDLKCRLFGRGRHVYRILYTIEGNEVLVHYIRHASQDQIHSLVPPT